MAAYYSKTKTRGVTSAQKGTPEQALDYLTDDHDSKRIASASKEEIDYIARINPGYKTDQEGGRVPLEGHGRCTGLEEGETRAVFLEACIPRHTDALGRKTTATEGYKSHTLTLPKELSLLAESNPQAAYRVMNKAVSEALDKAYPGKEYAAVSAIHRINNEAEIHFHAHVLVGKFVKDKATSKVHSLNNSSLMGGNAREADRLKAAWTEAVNRELAKEFQVQIRHEKGGKIALTMPDGRVLEPINRASRREIEKAIAPQITYIDKNGTEKTKAFSLTSMDAKILEIASQDKGRKGWNRDDFLRVFPKDSVRVERFEKRVETLKKIGYLSHSGRVTDQFFEHAKVKWGDSPQLHQMRTELERQRQKPGSKSVPEILQADQGKQERIRGLGLSGRDIVSAQRKWLEEIPKSTPEMVALIRAEKELAAFDKAAKEHLQSVPIERYTYESDKLSREREPLEKKVGELRKAAEQSLIHPANRTAHNQAHALRKAMEADTRHIDSVKSRIMGLERSKAEKMASAANPNNAKRIERWHDERIKPLKATQIRLSNQLEASRAEIERIRSQSRSKTQEQTRQTEKSRIVAGGNTLEAVRGILTRKGIRFLVSTAIGPGFTASIVANAIGNMLMEKQAIKTLEPARVDNLRRGIEVIRYSDMPEAKRLSFWQGKEERLAARMELAKGGTGPGTNKAVLNQKTQQAAERAENIGSLINKSERIARESTMLIPNNLEPLKGQIELINARCQAMGLPPPLTRRALDAFSFNGLQAAINDDPALRKMGQSGSQWVQLPVKLVEMALGKLKGLGLGLSLMR